MLPNGPTENLSTDSTLPLKIFPEYVPAVPEILVWIWLVVFQTDKSSPFLFPKSIDKLPTFPK